MWYAAEVVCAQAAFAALPREVTQSVRLFTLGEEGEAGLEGDDKPEVSLEALMADAKARVNPTDFSLEGDPLMMCWALWREGHHQGCFLVRSRCNSCVACSCLATRHVLLWASVALGTLPKATAGRGCQLAWLVDCSRPGPERRSSPTAAGTMPCFGLRQGRALLR